jgi:hypothetical protein
MILPAVGFLIFFVIFALGCILWTFVGVFVLRWTEPRVGKSAWSLLAFVVGAWTGAVGGARACAAVVVHLEHTTMKDSTIFVALPLGGVFGGLLAAWLLDQASEHWPLRPRRPAP